MGRSSSRSYLYVLILLALIAGIAAGFLLGSAVKSRSLPKGGSTVQKDMVAWLEENLTGQQEEEESAEPQPRIIGLVDIRPELRQYLEPGDVLFIIVTRPGESVPLAVKKIQPVGLPLIYTVGPEDVMVPDRPFEGSVNVKARVDKDGQANSPQSGDMTGQAGESVQIPSRDVHILIDTVVSGGES